MELRRVDLDALDTSLSRLRQLPEAAIRSKEASLRAKGQLTPLVAAQDEGRQGLALPEAFVEVEDARGLLAEAAGAREDPGPMGPGPDGVLGQPPPHGRVADRGDEFAPYRFITADLGDAQAGEWKPMLAGQLTRQSLDRHHDAGGKSGLVARAEAAPPSLPSVPRRTACATC